MTCPRCALADVTEPGCPRCGVVFAKLAARPEPAATVPRPTRRSAGAGRAAWPWVALGIAVLAAGAAVFARREPAARPTAPTAPVVMPVAAPDTSADSLPPPPALPSFEEAAPAPAPPVSAGLSAAEQDLAHRLVARLHLADAAEVQQAEGLRSAHPEDADVRRLLESVLVAAARRARNERRREQAIAWLQRAGGLARDARPWLALTELLGENGDWSGAEVAARAAIALEPRSAFAWTALGYALLRQDRGMEAADALEASLAIQDDPLTRALLARVNKNLADESGMTQKTLSHFHVRYDGEAHEDVGREILRALERHYATLAGSLGHQPAEPIAVILFSREAYFDASGAPAWSGGVYDQLDGRIRIPIGGLTASLTPHMEDTLIHELTHAFVGDLTRGAVTRDVTEGLAQYMEGKRSESLLDAQELRALADGRAAGVRGFYMGALSFVEYLVAQRGMGGMNDCLRTMGASGSVDEAFRQTYGRGHTDTRRAWQERLRQQYGS
jgi:tetratricopeptide (TPR) repeat protein